MDNESKELGMNLLGCLIATPIYLVATALPIVIAFFIILFILKGCA